MSKMALSDFCAEVKNHGFFIEVSPDRMVLIPSRFAVVTVGSISETSHGLRTLMTGGMATTDVTLKYLEHVFQSYPKYEQEGEYAIVNTFMKQWKADLANFLVLP